MRSLFSLHFFKLKRPRFPQSYLFLYFTHMHIIYFQVVYENTEGCITGRLLTLPASSAQVPSAEAILWYHGEPHSAVQVNVFYPLVYGNIARRREYQSFSGLVSLTVSIVSWNKVQNLQVTFLISLTLEETHNKETVTATACHSPPSPDKLSGQS